MDTHDTTIRDSGTRPASTASGASSAASDYQPEFFGPGGWALNDDMSAALARNRVRRLNPRPGLFQKLVSAIVVLPCRRRQAMI